MWILYIPKKTMYAINGTLQKIKHRVRRMSLKHSKYPYYLKTWNKFVGVSPTVHPAYKTSIFLTLQIASCIQDTFKTKVVFLFWLSGWSWIPIITVYQQTKTFCVLYIYWTEMGITGISFILWATVNSIIYKKCTFSWVHDSIM